MVSVLQVKNRGCRNSRGSHIVEFAAAISMLFLFLVLPLLNFAVVPARWMMAQELVNDYSRKLALCEKFSDAVAMAQADPSLQTRLQRIGGVNVQGIAVQMRVAHVGINGAQETECAFASPRDMQGAWLPDGGQTCSYTLEVVANITISPAVPLIVSSIPLTARASHNWGNLGRDPVTGRFYLNE